MLKMFAVLDNLIASDSSNTFCMQSLAVQKGSSCIYYGPGFGLRHDLGPT